MWLEKRKTHHNLPHKKSFASHSLTGELWNPDPGSRAVQAERFLASLRLKAYDLDFLAWLAYAWYPNVEYLRFSIYDYQ